MNRAPAPLLVGLLVVSGLAGAISFSGCLDDCTGMRLSWKATDLCPLVAAHPLAEVKKNTHAGPELPFEQSVEILDGENTIELPPGCVVIEEIRYAPQGLTLPEDERDRVGIAASPLHGDASMLEISVHLEPEDDEELVRNMTRDFLNRATGLPENEVDQVVEQFAKELHHVQENGRTTYITTKKRTTMNTSLHEAPDVSLWYGGGPTSGTNEITEWTFSLWYLYRTIELQGWRIEVLPTLASVEIPGVPMSKERTIEALRERLMDHDLPAPAAKDVEVYCSM